MQTLAVVPDELWIMMLTIIAFWFGGRFIKRDLRKLLESGQREGIVLLCLGQVLQVDHGRQVLGQSQ